MDFGLSETQRLLQESIARFGETHCTLKALRRCNCESSSDIQHIFDQLGMHGVLIAEEYGGHQGSLLDAVCIQEALGRAAAPVNFLAQSALAALALQEGQHLSKLANLEMRCGVALGAPALAPALEAPARRDRGITAAGNRIRGKALFALEAARATHILTADQTGSLYLVSAADAAITEMITIDRTRDFSAIVFDDAPAELARGGAARLLSAARILLAADMVGAAQTMLARAVAYAKQREQFGRVIGSFQAVKHVCAEMAARLEPCHAMLWYAAHSFDEIPDEAEWMAMLTKAHIGEVARFVARSAIEVFGGMGFAEESGMHFWFKRIGVSYQLLGSGARLNEDAAALQFGQTNE